MTSIFDAHVNAIDVPGGPQLASAQSITAMKKREGIDRVLLTSRDGEQLRELVASVDGAYAMPWIDPRAPDAADRVAELLADPRFVAIKLNQAVDPVAADDPILEPLFAVAGEQGVPVAFHCGHPPASMLALPWMIEKAAIKFPEVDIVLLQMGGCVFPYHEGSMEAAQRNANVYLEIGGMPHNWRVKEAVRNVGVDRVLFGSASPWFSARLELMKVHLAELEPPELDAVLGGNASRLFLGAEA